MNYTPSLWNIKDFQPEIDYFSSLYENSPFKLTAVALSITSSLILLCTFVIWNDLEGMLWIRLKKSDFKQTSVFTCLVLHFIYRILPKPGNITPSIWALSRIILLLLSNTEKCFESTRAICINIDCCISLHFHFLAEESNGFSG